MWLNCRPRSIKCLRWGIPRLQYVFVSWKWGECFIPDKAAGKQVNKSQQRKRIVARLMSTILKKVNFKATAGLQCQLLVRKGSVCYFHAFRLEEKLSSSSFDMKFSQAKQLLSLYGKCWVLFVIFCKISLLIISIHPLIHSSLRCTVAQPALCRPLTFLNIIWAFQSRPVHKRMVKFIRLPFCGS